MILVFGIILVSCEEEPEPEPETYTFWKINFEYSAGVSDYASLVTKGQFRHSVLTDAEFEKEKEDWTKNKTANVWTKDELKSYMIGLDLNSADAETEATWLVSTVKHGYFFVRGDGTTIHALLK